MHLKSHFYRIFLITIIGNLLSAQTFEISGRIKDEAGTMSQMQD